MHDAESEERVEHVRSGRPAHEQALARPGDRLEPVRGQTVLPHGADRGLGVDEVGGIELVELATAASR
jgi:hypothetical protein